MLVASDTTVIQKAADKILREIIDSWYENIAQFYITSENLAEQPVQGGTEELKRFHDENGHRLKFDKGDLDFTYGLRSCCKDGDFILEISVNNKVAAFDYANFQQRLMSHYATLGDQTVPTPSDLKHLRYNQIFFLNPSPQKAFTVEERGENADIMRLSFKVDSRYLEKCFFRPQSGKQIIEKYCVSPFRTVYAAVYRQRSE